VIEREKEKENKKRKQRKRGTDGETERLMDGVVTH
jgi:hypothetical protein